MRTITAPSRASIAETYLENSQIGNPTRFTPESRKIPEGCGEKPTFRPSTPQAPIRVPFKTKSNSGAEELYSRHNQMVLRVCMKYLRNREEAREATQETFLKAIRALPEFEGLSQTGTWIYRIAVNECLSRIESRRRDREKRERLGEEMALWNSVCDNQETFATRILQDVMDAVPKITRNVVWLSIGQGLTHAEIASSLGVSRVAVTRRIARFMRHAQSWRLRLAE